MSDDLDDLKSALNAATPAPDPAKKAEHLALAQKNFADLQGSRDGARLTSDGPKRGWFTGVVKMFSTMSTKGALTATTALAAVGLIMIAPQWLQTSDISLPKLSPPVTQEQIKKDLLLRMELEETADEGLSREADSVAMAPAPEPAASLSSESVVGGT